jgi:amino acid adenylation domain-containing protein
MCADGITSHEVFERQVARYARAPALMQAGKVLTYGGLNRLSNRLAHCLSKQGIGLGMRVGVCLERGPWLIATLLAVMKCGATYVPLDAEHPPERLNYILQDSAADVLIVDKDTPPWAAEARRNVLSIAGSARKLGREDPADLPGGAVSEDLCYVIYTSGSTGRPKGVAVAHGALRSVIAAMADLLRVTPEDRWLATTTISFDIAALEWLLPLSVGAQVIIASREEARDGRRLLAALLESQATILQGTPTLWRMLLATGGWPKTLRLALCGGDTMSADLAIQLTSNPGCEVWNLYGPTETTIWSTAHRLGPGFYLKSPPIGRAIGDTRLCVLDPARQCVPEREVGELYIGGPGLANGYLGKPELTAERFVPDPFDGPPNVRLYRTGDLVRWNLDGDLEFVGRADNQVKVRGYRIELGEIETALMGFSGVDAAAVVARKDGSGENRLCAYIAARSRAGLSMADIRLRLLARVPEYMVPSTLVRMDELPLTPNGKVDRATLASLDDAGAERGEDYAPPQTETEKALADIWAEILKVEEIGINDDFYTLGGHSLLANMILARIEDVLGVELTLEDLLENPTVGALSRLVDEASQAR